MMHVEPEPGEQTTSGVERERERGGGGGGGREGERERERERGGGGAKHWSHIMNGRRRWPWRNVREVDGLSTLKTW